MKPVTVITFVALLGLSSSAWAANFAVITSPPTILNLVILLLAFAAIAIGVQLLGVVKGGYLSRACQIFTGGFLVVALSQVSVLLQAFEIVTLPAWVTPGLMFLWAGIFFYGLFEAKRILA